MKRMLAMLVIMALAFGFLVSRNSSCNISIDERLGVPIVVYGANLSDAEKESVKKSLAVDNEAEVEEISVDGNDLVKYIKDGNSKATMYSSAKITRQDAGKGLAIQMLQTDNITQVT